MRKKKPEHQNLDDLAAECRERFLHHCRQWAAVPYHADKRKFAERAYEQVDIYLALRDLEAL